MTGATPERSPTCDSIIHSCAIDQRFKVSCQGAKGCGGTVPNQCWAGPAFTGSCGAAAGFEELSPSSGAEDSPGGGAVRYRSAETRLQLQLAKSSPSLGKRRSKFMKRACLLHVHLFNMFKNTQN